VPLTIRKYSQTASLLPALEGATGRYLRGFRVSLTSDRHFNFEFLFSFRCLFTSGLTRAVLSPDAVIYSDVVQRPFQPEPAAGNTFVADESLNPTSSETSHAKFWIVRLPSPLIECCGSLRVLQRQIHIQKRSRGRSGHYKLLNPNRSGCKREPQTTEPKRSALTEGKGVRARYRSL